MGIEDDSGDDSLGAYFREINEVEPLTAGDERALACRMEEMVCLDEVRNDLAAAEGGQPSGIAIALRLYERVYERCAVAEVLGEMERIDDLSTLQAQAVRQRVDYLADLDLGAALGDRLGLDAGTSQVDRAVFARHAPVRAASVEPACRSHTHSFSNTDQHETGTAKEP